MKPQKIIFIFLVVSASVLFSQERPQISFEDLMINAELDFKNIVNAREASSSLGYPVSIYLNEGIFIDAKGVEDNKPVYAVIKNILHPFENGEVMFYPEISAAFDLEEAKINFGNGDIKKQNESSLNKQNLNAEYLLVTESTNNRVMLFDFETGNLIEENFISSQINFVLPKQARQSPRSTISVSDQSADVVFDYDTVGTLMGIFAPIIGPHNGILDNVRGHNYHPLNNHLVVCNAQGGNYNRVVEFDTEGDSVGNFIEPNSGGLLGPFDIIFRTDDVLVTGSTSSAAHRYDLSGNYIDNFADNILFPQQMVEFPNGNIGIASFGSSGGLKIYDSNGNLANDFTSVSGLRGAHYLGNGNILVTNSAGVHEINGATGELIRTVIAGLSAQYVNSCDFSFDATPVELASFNANVNNSNVVLNWITSSELNNKGFEIQRLQNFKITGLQNWETSGFVEGKGTTSEINYYTFEDRDLTAGIYQYRLKQIDFDGTYDYSDIIEVVIDTPDDYSLAQNYPNPFNPITTIEYFIPSDGLVTLKVYNSLGEEVSVLVDEFRSAGKYSATFNDEKLSSGLYIYSLKSGSFYETRKMLLLK